MARACWTSTGDARSVGTGRQLHQASPRLAARCEYLAGLLVGGDLEPKDPPDVSVLSYDAHRRGTDRVLGDEICVQEAHEAIIGISG